LNNRNINQYAEHHNFSSIIRLIEKKRPAMPDCITITARENPVRLNSIQSRVINRKTPRALVAQLDRVLASEAKGQILANILEVSNIQ